MERSGNQISRRSLDGAELAKRNPGFSGHDYRFGHSNLQESQLAKVDSDAKEDAGRNDDHGHCASQLRQGVSRYPGVNRITKATA